MDGAQIDLYVAAKLHGSLGSFVAAVEDPLGSVVLRVVSDEAWPDVDVVKSDNGQMVAPPAAVALDLMDSGDPRHWVAAEKL